jgi:hypothetical protein
MADQSNTHRYTRETLSRHITEARIDAALAHADSVKRFAVRSLIMRNVLTGRVSTLMHARAVSDPDGWFASYTRTVCDVYTRERPEWQALVTHRVSSGDDPLHVLLAQAYRLVAAKIAARMGDAASMLEGADVIAEAYRQLRADRRLLAFPFDTPMMRWLCGQVMHAARTLYKHAEREVALDDDVPDMRSSWPSNSGFDAIAVAIAVGRLIADDRRIIAD